MKDNWTFGHIGITVRNMDKAIGYYQSLGAALIDGPATPDFDLSGWRWQGKPVSRLKNKSCHLLLGGLILELHQPVEGESLWTEFLDMHGEGVDHIDYFVDDVKKEADEMAARGFNIVLSIKEKDDEWVGVFLDTRGVGQFYIELSNKKLVDANKATWNTNNQPES